MLGFMPLNSICMCFILWDYMNIEYYEFIWWIVMSCITYDLGMLMRLTLKISKLQFLVTYKFQFIVGDGIGHFIW